MLKAGRVLVPNFQNRVLLGIATFTGMLLLVFWIAVNEPGRMDVFTQQYHGRSIENGASTFANNCAVCHGVDGKGITGKAPALNNPMLFLKDNPAKVAAAKLSDLQNQQNTLKSQIDTYNKNTQDLAAATEALKKAAPGSADEAALKKQIADLSNQVKNFDLANTQKQLDALTPQVQAAQADLDKLKAQGWDPNRDTRLTEVKWGGRLEDYLTSTVISGRPVSAAYWPQPMPAWGQQAGGPMRPDEVQDVVAYIMNFHDMAVNLTPKDVNQQFKLPSEGGAAAANKQVLGTNADPKALAQAGLGGGDAAAGEALYTSLGCGPACHLAGAIAPATKGTYTRIINERLKDPANANKTPEEYIAESILKPNAYVAPGFTAGVMPQDFGNKIDLQDLKNLIAYLETQK
jgi:mono/diheme cytochrome c family protein